MRFSFRRTRTFSIVLPLAAALGLATAGCGGGNSDNNVHMRVIDTVYGSTASVDCGTFVITQGDSPLLTFGTSSFYNDVPPGTNTISFTLSAMPGVTFPTLSEGMSTGNYYTDFIWGSLGSSSGSPNYPQQAFTVDDRTEPATGNSRMRVIDAAPDAGPIDIFRNGSVFEPDINYQYIGVMNEFPSGAQNIVVNAAGTSTNLINQSVTLNAGQFYTMVILESKPGGGAPVYTLLVSNDSNS